jgi:hypothetical protein
MDFLKKLLGSFVSKVDDDSPRGKVNTTDVAKVLRGGVIVGVSASVSYYLANLSPEMFGDYELAATVFLMALGELSVRFLKNNTEE